MFHKIDGAVIQFLVTSRSEMTRGMNNQIWGVLKELVNDSPGNPECLGKGKREKRGNSIKQHTIQI